MMLHVESLPVSSKKEMKQDRKKFIVILNFKGTIKSSSSSWNERFSIFIFCSFQGPAPSATDGMEVEQASLPEEVKSKIQAAFTEYLNFP